MSKNVIQKIIECRKVIDKVVKDTKGYGYSYVSGSQLLEKIRPVMDEIGLFLQVETENVIWTTFDYKNGKGEDKTDFIVTGEVKYTWINAEDPADKLINNFTIMGQQDDISKAFGSGLTYAERYFILKTLQAPTDTDDPDSRDTRGKYSAKPTNNYPSNINQQTQGTEKCSSCGIVINTNVYKFSIQKFGRALCMNCQKGER